MIGRQSTARNDAVHVRVIHEGLCPGMQDGKEADLSSEVLWIGSDGEQGL